MLSVGEANATVADIGSRQRGSKAFYYLILFGLMIGGAVIGSLAWPPNRGTGIFCGFIAGTVLYVFLGKRLAMYRFRKRFKDRGLPLNLPLKMEIAPDALVYQLGEVRSSANWIAVTELFYSRGYWIFLVQSSPYFAPERFFANEKAEWIFIKEALSHMSEQARSNSPSAIAFANSLSE
jgi:Na+/proline symporter